MKSIDKKWILLAFIVLLSSGLLYYLINGRSKKIPDLEIQNVDKDHRAGKISRLNGKAFLKLKNEMNSEEMQPARVGDKFFLETLFKVSGKSYLEVVTEGNWIIG